MRASWSSYSAVLAYLTAEESRRFVNLVRELDAVWISNESADVLPECSAKLNEPSARDQFLLCMNGEPVAVTAPHGQSVRWIGKRSTQTGFVRDPDSNLVGLMEDKK